MAYIKHREVTKYFNFSKVIGKEYLPKYVKDYVADDDAILVAYKTARDYGIFTSHKMVLFDNSSMFGIKKQVYAIFYKSISTIAITFLGSTVEFNLFLDSGYPLKLKFINTSAGEKTRLRHLFNAINRVVSDNKLRSKDISLLEDEEIEKIKY